jgi:branched-chain amino acid transport system substrate-binding protein
MACHVIPLLSLVVLLLPVAALAEIPQDKIKIGVLEDLPEPYAADAGNGGIVAAQLAAADFERKAFKEDAEILPGTTRGSPDKVLDRVRDLLDKEHVAAVLSSAGPLLDSQIAKMVAQRHRTLLIAGGDDDASETQCTPGVVVWSAGATARARALSLAVEPRGGSNWYILADESPLGVAVQAALQKAAEQDGGKIVGESDNVLGGANLSRVMPKIGAANPQVVALAEDDGDLEDVLRSALLAGLPHTASLVAPYARLTDIDQAGPATANGLIVAAPYYWDTDDRTRDFARRWGDRILAQHVTENAAEVYAATLSFLNAAKAADDVDSGKVLQELRRAPIKDTLVGTASIRADGRVVYDLTVYRVKTPDQIQARWAYYSKVTTIPGAQAFPRQACEMPSEQESNTATMNTATRK